MPIDAHNREFLEAEAGALAIERATTREDWLIERIAAHFPAFAPAIVAVGEHILEHETGP